MKNSLIATPPGSRFARIDFWILDVLGKKEHAAAVCLAQLEYWQRHEQDRLNKGDGDGWVRKSAADFSRVLRHLYGEDKVRAGLRLLVKKGWVEEGDETVRVDQLWRAQKKYRLVLTKINEASARYSAEKSKGTDFPAPGKPENLVPGADFPASRARKIESNTISSKALYKPPLTDGGGGGGGGGGEVPSIFRLPTSGFHATSFSSC